MAEGLLPASCGGDLGSHRKAAGQRPEDGGLPVKAGYTPPKKIRKPAGRPSAIFVPFPKVFL
jgi:hypothetical protein